MFCQAGRQNTSQPARGGERGLGKRGGGGLGPGESWPSFPLRQESLSYLGWAGAVQGQRGSEASRSMKGEGLVPGP